MKHLGVKGVRKVTNVSNMSCQHPKSNGGGKMITPLTPHLSLTEPGPQVYCYHDQN